MAKTKLTLPILTGEKRHRSDTNMGSLRRTTCICATLTTVMSICSMILVFSAFGVRGDDLVVASNTTTFDNLGTCVSVPNKGTLENAGYDQADYTCSSDELKEGNLQRLIAASAHSLINGAAQSPDNTDMVEMATVAKTAIAGGGTADRAVNATTFYNAVYALDSMEIPSTCALLYPGAVWTATMTAEKPVLPNVACSGGVVGSGSASVTTNELYSHCLLQHSFARSGPADGTYAMPLVGYTSGPNVWIWSNVSGFNETSSWETTAKMMLGARFAWSTTAYVPLMLATAFFAMDSAAVVLAEVTYSSRTEAEGQLTTRARVFKVMAATFIAKRRRANIFGILFVVTSWIFWAVCISAPWGFASRLPRPVCEAVSRQDEIFLDNAMLSQFYSKSGWKLDWTAHVCEMFALVSNTFTLIAVPLSEQLMQFPLEGSDAPIVGVSVEPTAEGQRVGIDDRAKRTGWLTAFCLVGTAFLITGNALVSNAFGMGWARAIAGQEGLGWQADTIGLSVFDMATSSLYAVITAGMVLAAVQARWLINGFNCNSSLVFYVWVVFAVAAFLPMVLFFQIQYFTDQDRATEECKVFNEGGSGFDQDVCGFKWIGVIVGVGLLAAAVVWQTVLGSWYSGVALCKALCNTEDSAIITKSKADNMPNSSDALAGGGGNFRSIDHPFFNFSTNVDRGDLCRLLQSSPPKDRPTGSFPAQNTRARSQLPQLKLGVVAGRIGHPWVSSSLTLTIT